MTAQNTEDAADTFRSGCTALGILLIVLGVGALALPLVVTLSTELFVGVVLLVVGVATLVHAFRSREGAEFFRALVLALVYMLGGIGFLINPLAGAVALTVLLGCVFVAEGSARAILAMRIRPAQGWGWILASGLVSVMLGMLLFAGIADGSSLVTIGFLIGCNLVTAGVSFIAYARSRSASFPALRKA